MDLRTWLVIATIVGFVITIGGLVAAWFSARDEYNDAQKRIDNLERLQKEEREEERGDEPAEERIARWTAEYEKHDLIRPNYDNLPYIASYESRRLLGLVLKSTGRDFLVAAFGLLVSTAASVGSLFLAS